MLDKLARPFLQIAKNDKYGHILDVSLNLDKELFRFKTLECHLVLYPFSRKIRSEHIKLNPFVEYAEDISEGKKSAYSEIISSASQFFGLFLVAVLLVIFFLLKKEGVTSRIGYMEVLVSIFGVYVVGKDFWDDLDGFFKRLTKNWRIKYMDSYYSYELEKNTTLMRYSNLAKKERYGYSTVLPEKMDYIVTSNSNTVRLYFETDDFKDMSDTRAHLLSIRIDPEYLEEFEKRGCLLGIKLAFSRNYLLFEKSHEFFQSIKMNEPGCLDDRGEWLSHAVYYRRVLRHGNIRCDLKSTILKDKTILESAL